MVSNTGLLVSSIAVFAILLSAAPILLALYPGDPHAVVAGALREFALTPQFVVAEFAALAGLHTIRRAGHSKAGRTIRAFANVIPARLLVLVVPLVADSADLRPLGLHRDLVECTGFTARGLTVLA